MKILKQIGFFFIAAIITAIVMIIVQDLRYNQNKLVYEITKNISLFSGDFTNEKNYLSKIILRNKGNNKIYDIKIKIDSQNNILKISTDQKVNIIFDENIISIQELDIYDQLNINIYHEKIIEEYFIIHKDGTAKVFKNISLVSYLFFISFILMYILLIINTIFIKKNTWKNEIFIKEIERIYNDQLKENVNKYITFNKKIIKTTLEVGNYIEIKINYDIHKITLDDLYEDFEEEKNDDKRVKELKGIDPLFFYKAKMHVDFISSKYLYINCINNIIKNNRPFEISSFILKYVKNDFENTKYVYLIDDKYIYKDNNSLKLIRLSLSHINVIKNEVEIVVDEIIIREPLSQFEKENQ